MNQSVVIAPIGESLPEFLSASQYSKIIVITDNNTRKHCYPALKAVLPPHRLITVQAGEAHKTLATCEQIWEAMTKEELDRHALTINVGGGVIGDMGGFCAAVYKRGIHFIQVPTTLLSQVDASVGGKLGIDFQGFKNHLGVFNIPESVLIDPAFLKTLPEREIRSGFAEIIKHCLIADAAKWEQVRQKDFEEQQWPDLIAHSVNVKKQIVDADPTEKGLRKILNFGHTLGHAVETCFLNKEPSKRLFHGEAIAIGMIMESYLAFERKMITQDLLTDIEAFLFTTYGKIEITPDDIDNIIALTRQDKKNKGKQVRFSLLSGAGQCAYDITVTAPEMRKSIAYYLG